jgi:MFS family permease
MTKATSKSVRQALADSCLRKGSLPPRNRGVWPLYAAAFGMATALSVLWTAVPFILRNIGGTEEHVGYAFAANMLGYLLCLLFAAARLGHLNPRHTTRGAAAAMFVATFVMLGAVYQALACDKFGSPALIWAVITAGALAGGAMSLYWPYLMSWVSADYEGVTLNRRLGTYNGMWSSAAIIGPLIGGALAEQNTLAPVGVSVGALATCFVLLLLAHDESVGTAASSGSVNANETGYDSRLLLRMKWMARISLFCSWLWLSVARTQFALRFIEIGFSETQFGILMATFGICNFLTLTGSGRFGFWHFRPMLLPAVQAALAVSVLLLVFGSALWAFVLSFAIMGCAFGLSFSSHLYYGTCGSRNRSKQMAIHEATISLGVIIGSATGGYLAANLGAYQPYWFAIAALALGLLAQIAVWATLGRKPNTEN